MNISHKSTLLVTMFVRTWRNAELGETMIQTLEQQSLELARDSQRYREQWHLEALALRDEMDKNEVKLHKLTCILFTAVTPNAFSPFN